ncbi:glycosyltransferase family 2 protein, partial [Candidatus Bathyarchaeota archaeon]|nr:glycosyltransferase family 2 protein [Candidatus Bathyarchaeota archaeon]
VDNNSSDGTPEFLALIDSETRRSLNLKIIPQKFNGGLSQATDVAIGESSGEWLLSCNPDIVFTDDFRKMLEYAKANSFPILAPQLITTEGTPQYCMRQFTLTRLFFCLTRLGRLLSRFLARDYFGRDLHYGYRLFDHPVLVEHPIASFFLIKRSALLQLGHLFSRDLPVYFGDTDLFSRASLRGMRMVLVPTLRIRHQRGYSRTVLHPEVHHFMFVQSMIRYAYKWHLFPRILTALVFVDAVIAPLTQGLSPTKVNMMSAAFRLKGALRA